MTGGWDRIYLLPLDYIEPEQDLLVALKAEIDANKIDETLLGSDYMPDQPLKIRGSEGFEFSMDEGEGVGMRQYEGRVSVFMTSRKTTPIRRSSTRLKSTAQLEEYAESDRPISAQPDSIEPHADHFAFSDPNFGRQQVPWSQPEETFAPVSKQTWVFDQLSSIDPGGSDGTASVLGKSVRMSEKSPNRLGEQI